MRLFAFESSTSICSSRDAGIGISTGLKTGRMLSETRTSQVFNRRRSGFFRGSEEVRALAGSFGELRAKLHQNGPSKRTYSDMAKAPVIEKHQFAHMVKVAAVTGQSPQRDVALLAVA